MKSNIILNELFNRLIDQSLTIHELRKEIKELKENNKAFKVEKTEIKRFPYALDRAMSLWFKEWDVKQCYVMIELITRLVEKPYSVVQYDEQAQLLEWYKDSRDFEDDKPSYVTTLDGKEAGEEEKCR